MSPAMPWIAALAAIGQHGCTHSIRAGRQESGRELLDEYALDAAPLPLSLSMGGLACWKPSSWFEKFVCPENLKAAPNLLLLGLPLELKPGEWRHWQLEQRSRPQSWSQVLLLLRLLLQSQRQRLR